MKKASLCLASLSWLFMLPGMGLACSCLPLDPKIPYKTHVLKRRDKASVVFAGKIRSLEFSKAYQSMEAKFDVYRYWKGGASNEVTIYVEADNGANCGLPFAAGQSWLVYAYTSGDGILRTASCTFTKELSGAQADIKALGKGKGSKSKRGT